MNIEFVRVLIASCQMNSQDFGARSFAWQVDKKDFIEASFTYQFRGQGIDVVSGGDDENLILVFCNPGQKGSKNALCRSCFSAATSDAFSISSIQSTQGDITSAVFRDSRNLRSVSP